jgi:hypothetical protein
MDVVDPQLLDLRQRRLERREVTADVGARGEGARATPGTKNRIALTSMISIDTGE